LVVPCYPALCIRTVISRLLVLDFTYFRERQKSVGKADRNQQLRLVFCSEFNTEPFAVSRRADAKIDCDVKHAADRAADEFDHWGAHVLIVKTSEDRIAGTRVRILNEFVG